MLVKGVPAWVQSMLDRETLLDEGFNDVIVSAIASQITGISIDCLLNCRFRRRSKKTSKLRGTGLCAGIHRWPVNSPHKKPVTRKIFPFDDVIMSICIFTPGRLLLTDIKPASNDFGCICEQIWKDQCSMEVYITINRTKWCCSKSLIKLVMTTTNFFYIRYAT